MCAVLLLGCAAGIASAQQQRMDQLLQQLDSTVSFSDPTISPDGNWITWIEDDPAAKGARSYLLNRTQIGRAHV